ncbi:protein SYM1 [Ceratitis capitata]|uniref:Protein SYM1 n=1 Tax=Ceratitis capitata TaxID=7213 RepID=W8B268_CERCA|nr:protein SYM1 [Ceratitis capitata]
MVVPATVNFLKSKWRIFASAHPLAKGVICYSVVFPTSCFLQQTIEGKDFKDYDWMRILRYGLFGSCYVAPTLYAWLRCASTMWPQTNLRVGALKAAVEQISYAPFATTSFYFGMSLLEGKGFDGAVEEVKDKFPKTLEIAICIIPLLQTINFGLIPEPKRIFFNSFYNIFWLTFISHTHRMNDKAKAQQAQLQAQPRQQLKQFQHHLSVPKNESFIPKANNVLAL